MIFPEKKVILKDGRTAVLRSAVIEDAPDCLEYLRVTAAETPFLLREPEEANMTLRQEEAFLGGRLEDPDSLMLIARIDGEYAGDCGLGLGRIMIETVVDVAKELGYEQMELEVINGNDRARHLYESLGFTPFGVRPHALKYKDGTYADETLMVKML